jgi:hypothetical protein
VLESKPVDLSAYVGKNIRFRFHFDTLDGQYNTGFGWAITAMRISDDPTKVCTELADDGSPEKARGIATGGNVDGQICPTGDVDFFQFTGEGKQPFSATVNITSTAGNWQPSLVLLSVDGKTIVAEGKQTGSSVQLNTTLPEAAKYYLKVTALSVEKNAGPGVNYRLSLIQDITPPTVKLTKPANGSINLALPIALAAEAADGENPVGRVEFLIQPAGVSVDKAERVSVDETAQDGWTGSIPAGYTGKLEGAAVFARAFDQAGNHTDSPAVLLAGDGTIPVTRMDSLPAENGSTMISLSWATVSKEKVDHFELQYQVNDGEWQEWAEPLAGTLRKTSFFAKNATAYGFRIRAVTENGTEEFAPEAQVKTKVEAECVPDKFEPGDNLPANSPALQSGSGQLHNLCGLKDEDWTSMLLQGGKTYTFTAQPTELAAGVTLQLFDMTGKALTDEVSPEDLLSTTSFDFQPETSATYLLRARAANENLAGTRSIYSISYDQAAPFSPLPVVCGAILIPLLTAVVKLFGRMKAGINP